MIETLERTPQTLPAVADERLPAGPEVALPASPEVADGLDVRRALRLQVARLESRLAQLAGELGRPGRSVPLPAGVRAAAGPRLLGVGELESLRDHLVARIHDAEDALTGHTDSEAQARAQVEAMLADPAAHRWEVVHREELGLPACGAYHVRPRFGLLGMLFGWWCVKLSSGCP
jgi:hypothetical protein